jgi:hypothetical protein
MTRPPVYNASRMPRGARPDLCVYVGRQMFAAPRRQLPGHLLANPFKIPSRPGAAGRRHDAEREAADRAECLARYRHWLTGIPDLAEHVAHLRSALADQMAAARFAAFAPGLVCWCAPQACHADVLADLVAMSDAEVATTIRPAAHEGEDLFRSVWCGHLFHAGPLADWLQEQGDPRGGRLASEFLRWHGKAAKRAARDRAEEARVLAPLRDLFSTPGVTGSVSAMVRTSDPKGDAAFRSLVGRLMETDPHTWEGFINLRLRPFAFPVPVWPGERDVTGDPHHGRPRKPTDYTSLTAELAR